MGEDLIGDNGRVVEDKDTLYCHGWDLRMLRIAGRAGLNLRDDHAPEGVGDGGGDANNVKLDKVLPKLHNLNFDILPRVKRAFFARDTRSKPSMSKGCEAGSGRE